MAEQKKALVVYRRNGLLPVVIGPMRGETLCNWRYDYTPFSLILDVDFSQTGEAQNRYVREIFHADEVSRVCVED